MKTKWWERLLVKALAFIMAVTATAAAAMMGFYQMDHYDVIWEQEFNINRSAEVVRLFRRDSDALIYLLSLLPQEQEGQGLSEEARSHKEELMHRYDAHNTNLRWIWLGEDKQVRLDNLGDGEQAPPLSETWSIWLEFDMGWLHLWVDENLPVADEYRQVVNTVLAWRDSREQILLATGFCLAAGVVLAIYLCVTAGRKPGQEGIALNWFHQLPGDVVLVVVGVIGMALAALMAEWVVSLHLLTPLFISVLGLGVAVSLEAALGLSLLITFTVRCKTGTLLCNTLAWKGSVWCWHTVSKLWRTFARAMEALPLIWKTVAGCMGYLLLTMTAPYSFLWLMVTVGAMCYLCCWAYQWKQVRIGTQHIIGGNPEYHIDASRMLPDLRGHADELNNLGQTISAAVDARIRSERFKAELITNVSHDLKTPLTSIINYVDLLKKEDIGNPKAAEYIEVLDRKSQRLKKLTEDLVDASKASTGNLTVNWERLDLRQLADQALGEHRERLEGQRLTVVPTLPEGPVWVEADGRHLWRVLDNLLTNCAKYALEGTRVYMELRRMGDVVVMCVKNISRDPLDLPAQRLMERFVRGDESRTGQGSGLGLSIAQSLTELQRGTFGIEIDGDLFKAVITLPLAL